MRDHDFQTNTPRDAGLFESFRGGIHERESLIERYSPSNADLADFAQDRRDAAAKAERDAAARAAGHYVPGAAMSIAASCCAMALGQRRVFGVDVDPMLVKGCEGYVSITPTDRLRPGATPEQIIEAMAVCYPGSEATFHSGAVWAKVLPFASEVSA